MKRSDINPMPEYYERYIKLVADVELSEALDDSIRQLDEVDRNLLARLDGRTYAPGKWTVKQLAGHVSDGERVFAYRALCIARGDTAPLPGMDQNVYVEHANFDARTLSSLADELERLRASTLDLLGHLDEPAWLRRGTANGSEMSVRALAHVIAGHEAHHLKVLRDRYLEKQG